MGELCRDGIVDGYYPAGEFSAYMVVQPGPQPCTLPGIAPLRTKDSAQVV